MDWIIGILKAYPELAVLSSLAIGYWVGSRKFGSFSLGAVTGTLLAAIVVGQIGIEVGGPMKSLFFLLFLFAVGYGIGPQFVSGLAKDGLPQAAFAVVMCLFCLAFPVLIAVVAGYDLGAAAGLFAGSQTISASMGLATDAIHRTGIPPDQVQQMLGNMPVAYAVTYIFGTVGSAFLLSRVIPPLLGIDLKEACADYENRHKQGQADAPVGGTAWHEYELRAYKISGAVAGLTVGQLEAKFPGRHLFVEGLKRDGQAVPMAASIQLRAGDILAIGGDHQALIGDLSAQDSLFEEVADPQLLNQPVSGVDVFVSNRNVVGKTLGELATWANAHGVFLRGIKRGLTGVEIPVLPTTKLHRGDVITLFGLDRNIRRAAKNVGVIDEKSTVTDVAFMAAAIVVGAMIGAITVRVGGVPITLSTAGGALIAGLVFGWIRSVHPTFGYIPNSTVWFMNSVGLNVFIAVVGLSTGPLFLAGLKQSGISLFLWGIAATSLPLLAGALVGRYVFRFHPAILFGCCAGARTTTAALGMINEKAGSNVPSLGYTVTYAVGNTLLTLWGLVIILILG